MATTNDLLHYLFHNRVGHSLLTHISASSARELSSAIGVPEHYIARTSILRAGNRLWMVVVPGDCSVCSNALRDILCVNDIQEIDHNGRSLYFPNCDPTTIPPFGNLHGFPVLADRSFSCRQRMIFPAYSRMKSIFIRWRDYVRLVDPVVAEFCEKNRRHSDCRVEQNATRL
jgi:prolyl-tRNA editing enzyme YbaK/EbsC (Cys-tRNA(Pro) deacylase)